MEIVLGGVAYKEQKRGASKANTFKVRKRLIDFWGEDEQPFVSAVNEDGSYFFVSAGLTSDGKMFWMYALTTLDERRLDYKSYQEERADAKRVWQEWLTYKEQKAA